MDRKKLFKIIVHISQIIIDSCETDSEVEQVKKGVEEYIDFSKSIPHV
jgi:hypothetical protein